MSAEPIKRRTTLLSPPLGETALRAGGPAAKRLTEGAHRAIGPVARLSPYFAKSAPVMYFFRGL
jgi:hypothetical protein